MHRIIGEVHVLTSNRRMIQHVISRMRKGAWKALPREVRKELMREMIAIHAENFAMYAAVMGGRI